MSRRLALPGLERTCKVYTARRVNELEASREIRVREQLVGCFDVCKEPICGCQWYAALSSSKESFIIEDISIELSISLLRVLSIKSFALATICRSLCSDLFSVLTQMNNRDARGWGMIAICACGGRRLYIYACHIPKVNRDSRCRTLLIPLLEAEQDLDGGSGREEAASWRYPRSANLKSAYLHIFGD